MATLIAALDELTDDELLAAHRIVCKRAAAIYGPMFQNKRDANYEASRHVFAGAPRRARG